MKVMLKHWIWGFGGFQVPKQKFAWVMKGEEKHMALKPTPNPPKPSHITPPSSPVTQKKIWVK